MSAPTLLEARNVNAWYGKSHILKDINLTVREGELVGLLGRNGSGKTTTMRALTGLMPRMEGQVIFQGAPLNGLESYEISRRGLGLVPENRGIFSSLAVDENLTIAARKGSRWQIADIYRMFPALENRKLTPGGKLSGGEQQMLAIGRALVTNPQLLLLDEPTEGLAPVIVDRLVTLMADLRAEGLAMILVEQSLDVCLAVADRMMILDDGHIVWAGNGEALMRADDIRARHLTLEQA